MALLMSSYALMIGLWQLTDPPACLREAMQRPELSMFRIDFEKQLAAALLALWAGTVGVAGREPHEQDLVRRRRWQRCSPPAARRRSRGPRKSARCG